VRGCRVPVFSMPERSDMSTARSFDSPEGAAFEGAEMPNPKSGGHDTRAFDERYTFRKGRWPARGRFPRCPHTLQARGQGFVAANPDADDDWRATHRWCAGTR